MRECVQRDGDVGAGVGDAGPTSQVHTAVGRVVGGA